MRDAIVIDLGQHWTVAAHVSAADTGALHIEEFKRVRTQGFDGVAIDAAALGECLQQALAGMPSDHGVTVAVGGALLGEVRSQGYVPIVPAGRRVASEDLLKVVNHSTRVALGEGREAIQTVPSCFKVDDQPIVGSPLDAKASRLEVETTIVTAPDGTLAGLERALQAAGHSLNGVIAAPIATALGVTAGGDNKGSFAVVDLGESYTGVAVFEDSCIAGVATLKVNSRHITTDIQQLLGTDFAEAERLKTEQATCDGSGVSDTESVSVKQLEQDGTRPVKRRVLCEIVESRVREIGRQVRGAIESVSPIERLSGGVVLAGGGAALDGLSNVIASELAPAKVRLGKPQTRSSSDDAKYIATALGAAKYALQSSEQELQPAGGAISWKDRVRILTAIFGTKN